MLSGWRLTGWGGKPHRKFLRSDTPDFSGCNGLAIPGGESTTISRLIDKNNMYEPIRSFSGGIFATCAGMVLMATHVDDDRIHTLGLIDMTVDRNAFGRQRESFEADLPIKGLDGGPFHAIFIRAPVATPLVRGYRYFHGWIRE